MIRAAIYGRLESDPVPRTMQSGKRMMTASLAVDVAREGKDEDTEWFSIVGFGTAATSLGGHQKGDLVAVMGQLSRSRFTGRDGEARANWSLVAEAIISVRTVRPGSRPALQAEERARLKLRTAARLATRQRRCHVYENIGPGYHLLVADDGGALVLIEQIINWEVAVWLAVLVNQALAAERGKPRRPRS